MGIMKTTLSVTIEEDLKKWIEEQVKTGKYRNISHFVEDVLTEYRRKQEKKE